MIEYLRNLFTSPKKIQNGRQNERFEGKTAGCIQRLLALFYSRGKTGNVTLHFFYTVNTDFTITERILAR